MSLKTSKVYKCLEKKTLILGFEITDLFLVFSVLAVLNFCLGTVPYKFFWTWGPAGLLALSLRIGKKGKPENFLLHLIQFYSSPGIIGAFEAAKDRIDITRKGNTSDDRTR